jgi:hypothetical protein
MTHSTFRIFALACIIALLCSQFAAFAAVITERATVDLNERAAGNVAPLTMDRNWINVVLARANYYRALHAAVPFVWSPSQAVFAQQQANKCLLQHSVSTLCCTLMNGRISNGIFLLGRTIWRKYILDFQFEHRLRAADKRQLRFVDERATFVSRP